MIITPRSLFLDMIPLINEQSTVWIYVVVIFYRPICFTHPHKPAFDANN